MADSAILCVDDEVVILDSLKEQLKRQFGNRYLYEVAECVTEAWEIIDDLYQEGIQVLVIVSDWLMPGIKGDQFLIEVYQRYPTIKTVMLTGQADAAAIERAHREAHLSAYLRKPWSEQELASVIATALE